ncbi:hypothetical protein PAMP_006687 [Pampus punctatissimus]
MSIRSSQKTTTSYRKVDVVSPEPVSNKVISTSPVSPLPSPLPYALNGSYETVRYLVPVQQAMQQQSYVLVQQPMIQQQHIIQQPMMQQVVSPMYLQNLNISNQETDILYQKQHSTVEEDEEEEEEEEEEEDVVEVEEVEIVNIIQQKPLPVTKINVKTEQREVTQVTKMDTRYFGELLADVYRKNCDIHSCISEHVSKIRGQKHQLDPSNDYKMEKNEVEALIPKGATELTKQQIRYLLQTRLTADKSMRLLLSTFSSLREELLHMSEDMRHLESEKESLERDLSFKADQARQYDCLLEAVRENNRQLQLSLKESTSTQRSLETQLMSVRNTDSSHEFKIKELQCQMRTLEKENEMLRGKLAGQISSSTLHIQTEELSRQYKDQLSTMRQEKDQEIQRLRAEISRIQISVTTEKSSSSSAEKSLQLKISELLAMLDQRQVTITQQEEEIKKLMQELNDSSKNVTKTTITKRYRNQYPILGLLSNDYQLTSPVKEAKTIVIERTGEMIKQEIITTP